jgi:hypothetical protein
LETLRGGIEHQAEMRLALTQGLLPLPQRLRHLLLLVDLRGRADPHRDGPGRIPHGAGAAEMPPIGAVGAPEAVHEFKGLARLDRVPPDPDIFFDIVGMDDLRPRPTADLNERQPGEL